MKFLAYSRGLAAKFLHRSQINNDLEDELRSHIQYRADDLERSGLKRSHAERLARIEFGGRGRYQEECQEALGGNLIETVIQDARFSLRALRKSPGFAIAAIFTLALAIGANAIVFGILDGFILRPLNVPQAQDLWGTMYGEESAFQSYRNYVDLRDRNRSFDGLAAWKFAFAGLDRGHDPLQSTGFATSGNYFDVLRIQPYLGRLFHSSDEHGPNSAPYLVLSYDYWHSHFAADRSVVGHVVQVDKPPFTIIGVAPPDFRGTLLFLSPDFFMPMVNQEQVDGENLLDSRSTNRAIFEAFGHLKPGVTYAQALADVNTISAQLEKAYPKEVSHKKSSLIREGLTSFAGPARAFVAGLMLLATMILLAACANLGSLFAARAADRSREVALRLALGSSRSRILRGLLTEAVFISLIGGAIGLLGSIALLGRLSTWEPFPGAPIHLPVTPDATLYVFALALALLSGLLFGIVPVRQVLKANPYVIIKAGPGARIG